MRILRARVGTVDVPLRRPFTTALRTTSTVRGLGLRVETDAGIGWGAAAPTPAITGDTEDAILADLHAAARALAGVTVEHPADGLAALDATRPPATASGRAAVDIALHDLWAQALGEPLHRVLGGARDRVATDLTVSVGDPDAMAAEASEALVRGFTTLKVKVGTDVALDHARLAAVRRVAPDATLRVDANQGWTPRQAIDLVRGFEDAGLGIELVEQPVARHDLAGLKQVTDAVDTPILADEAVFDAADARAILDARAADLLNVKLMKSGGLVEALRIVDLAEEAGVGCMVGAMMEPTVGIAAAAALACGRAGVTMADLDPPFLCATEPVLGGPVLAGDTITPADAPGLGITDIEGATWLT